MNGIKEFLRDDYRKKALYRSKDCISFEKLYDYINGISPIGMRKGVESHLAKCYHCLDVMISIHSGIKDSYYKRRWVLKKEVLFLIMAVICFLSSFIFSRFFLQFLTATIILGIKWIVDSKSSRMLIMIYEAWKRGGESEAGRILKNIDTKSERR